MADHDDDLVPTQTAGYTPGQKKTLDEYNQLDAQDESLKKWKESLGLNGNSSIFFFPSFILFYFLYKQEYLFLFKVYI